MPKIKSKNTFLSSNKICFFFVQIEQKFNQFISFDNNAFRERNQKNFVYYYCTIKTCRNKDRKNMMKCFVR